MKERMSVLAVAPHPDDETIFMGGTLAQYARSGADVHVVLLTNGGKGRETKVDPKNGGVIVAHPASVDLAAYKEKRLHEYRKALRSLGVMSTAFLGIKDTQIGQNTVGPLLAEIVRVNPHTILSFSEASTTGHPDHTAAAFALYSAVSEILSKPDEYGNPRLRDISTILLPPEVGSRLTKWSEVKDNTIKSVDIRKGLNAKYAAVSEYQSQAHLMEPLLQAGVLTMQDELYHERLVRDPWNGSIRVLGLNCDTREVPMLLNRDQYETTIVDFSARLEERLDTFTEKAA